MHGKAPIITYGRGVPHQTSMHTYKTVNVDHTQTIIARWSPISPKFGRALGHTVDYRLQTGIARIDTRPGVFPM